MCNFVTQASTPKALFGDNNRLRFRNLLDDLRFHAERITKLSSAVRTSIFRDIHLPIRLCRRSRYAFMPLLLPRLLPAAFILILFALAATLHAWWGMCVLIHSQLATSSFMHALSDSFSRLSCLMISSLSTVLLRVECCYNIEVLWSKRCFRLIRKNCGGGGYVGKLNTYRAFYVRDVMSLATLPPTSERVKFVRSSKRVIRATRVEYVLLKSAGHESNGCDLA